MSRRVTFRQCDLERAIRAAKSAGGEKAQVEVDVNGKITVRLSGDPERERRFSDEGPNDRDLEIVF